MTQQIGGSDAATELAALKRWSDPAPAITPIEYRARMDKARALMAEEGLDALLIDAGASLAYYAGVPWGASERLVAMLLPVAGEPILICPRFERGSLEADLKIAAADLRLWEEDESPAALVADALRTLGVARLGIDPAMAFLFVERIRQVAPDVTLVAASGVIDGCRRCKTPAELALMQQAKSMTLEVHRRTARILRAGITATEVKRFIEAAHRALGASGNSFCIVQFGRSTAYPHGLPGESVLAEGDMVLIDTGCTIGGYHSDITRSYVFGEADAEQRRIWNLEREAQQAAFDAVRPGLPCGAIDAAARAVLEGAGLGPDYALPGLPHRTGHGIGLSIHEAPYLVRGDNTPLEPGMCFSNEPMIVVPDRFGVRLEDHFHVTETGAAWFTPPSVAIDQPFA
ncbi:Xaa-Pro peptidase family protein [Sphingobium sp. BYY-5]|uniref:M24 family metallopeptidase n=1 Tax=Sphingobium sp. BYY-5 TaxID=2926400 RepID=UPI001FA7AEB9|nr:Xaa-Pro peptidase family protein [Sphingobium sp. BYY-5]MCI4591834.1 Xaa-Pro peptidase family protein [Sphingobium sp. BYY-5]